MILCGKYLHLPVLILKVEECRKGKACEQGAEEVVEGYIEGINPLLAEVELERRMLFWILGER